MSHNSTRESLPVAVSQPSSKRPRTRAKLPRRTSKTPSMTPSPGSSTKAVEDILSLVSHMYDIILGGGAGIADIQYSAPSKPYPTSNTNHTSKTNPTSNTSELLYEQRVSPASKSLEQYAGHNCEARSLREPDHRTTIPGAQPSKEHNHTRSTALLGAQQL